LPPPPPASAPAMSASPPSPASSLAPRSSEPSRSPPPSNSFSPRASPAGTSPPAKPSPAPRSRAFRAGSQSSSRLTCSFGRFLLARSPTGPARQRRLVHHSPRFRSLEHSRGHRRPRFLKNPAPFAPLDFFHSLLR
jgi:hypothetical protein